LTEEEVERNVSSIKDHLGISTDLSFAFEEVFLGAFGGILGETAAFGFVGNVFGGMFPLETLFECFFYLFSLVYPSVPCIRAFEPRKLLGDMSGILCIV
jgi:hypothetical protein